jgi:UDP-2-acetamido-3-amino-2,3-dideoxy-glucuronate N-acetyltransferase
MAVFDDTLPWRDKLLLYPHQINWENNIPIPTKADPERLDIPEAEPLRMECKHFLHCISNGSDPATDGREGLQVLKILNAGQRSLDAGGRKFSLHANSSPPPDLSVNEGRSAPSVAPKSGRYFVHETAVIDPNCKIGSGSKIWHFSHILSNSDIGEKCNIGQNVVIGPDVTIGNKCKIQNNVSVYKGVTLEDGVFCGPSMVFTNIYNPRAQIPKMDQVRPTLVKHGATLGANCTVVCGVTIGRYAFVGAGAVVTRNVPHHALMAGNPARRIGWSCECGERLTESLECIGCGKKYQRSSQGLKEYSRQDTED